MKNTRGKTIAERIEHYSIPVPHCGCHIWIGGVCGKGYGMMSIGGQNRMMAHRAAWTLANGPIPEGMQILHKCDIPACVNPDHLFLGTAKDNMTDKSLKGRAKLADKVDRHGAMNGRAKLNETQALEIIASRLSKAELGRRYGMSHSAICDIKSGKNWRYLKNA